MEIPEYQIKDPDAFKTTWQILRDNENHPSSQLRDGVDLTQMRLTNPKELSPQARRLLCPRSPAYKKQEELYDREPSQLEGLPWSI